LIVSPQNLFSPRERAAACGLVALCFLGCVAAPLGAYVTAIALFGFVHVGAEMRFVDRAFAARAPKKLYLRLAAPLAVALLARLSGQLGLAPPSLTLGVELVCGGVMAALTLMVLRRRRVVAATAAIALAAGAALAPFSTFLALAILHNFTPLAFVADCAPKAQRRRMLGWLLPAFVALPVAIATGWPGDFLERFGLLAPDASPMRAGPLEAHLTAYVPQNLLDTDWALPLFSAAVFVQTMHYAAVIHLLPRLVGDEPRPTLARWPKRAPFAVALGATAVLSAAFFLRDFGVARKFYALAALAHSWIEIPLLLLALERGGDQAKA